VYIINLKNSRQNPVTSIDGVSTSASVILIINLGRKSTSEWFRSSFLHVDSISFALSAATSQNTSSPGDPIATAMLSAPTTNASLATNSLASMTIAAFWPRTLLATAVFNHACKLQVNLLRRPEAFIMYAPKEDAGFMKGRLLPLENSTN
jgi:hypothetical protein